ncbi:hypothetical protein V8B97DRAFT_1922225 [Scleroderma yunnanense]
MFVLLLMPSVSPEVQWLAFTLLHRAPSTITAGCRLILSIRKAASSFPSYEPGSNFIHSSVVFGDRSNLSHP